MWIFQHYLLCNILTLWWLHDVNDVTVTSQLLNKMPFTECIFHQDSTLAVHIAWDTVKLLSVAL